MPKGDQARAHLIGISTAGASPRRMVILIELRTYTVPGCSGSIVSSSHRLAKKKKKFWFTGQTSSCWIGMRVAQEGTGVPIYIPLRWIFLYHSSYHCTEWVRKQWNQKKNKGNCQSAQPYRFGSDETRRDVHRLRRVTCLDGQRSLRALYQKERKKEKETICSNYPK